MTRPKDVDKRRIILDLSYPRGTSLNDHVDRDKFDQKNFALNFVILVRTAETSFFVNNKRYPVWYISLGEYKKLSIYIARKLNNIHNMCNLCSYYQCCSLYLHVY